MKRFFLITLLFANLLYCQATITLAGGSKGGKYNKLAHTLKNIIEKNTPYKIKIENTNGSIENIEGLLDKKYDMAIVQSDVFFRKAQNYENSSNYPILPVASFYREPIYIITNKPEIINVNNLADRSVNIGTYGSGLKDSAQVILKSIGIYDKIEPVYQPTNDAINALITNKIDAIFINYITKELEEKLKSKELHIVPISPYIIKALHQTFPFFETYYYKLDKYKTIPTISMRAMLLANGNIDKNIIYNIIKTIYAHKDTDLREYLKDVELFDSNPIDKWHSGVEEFANNKGITLFRYKSTDISIIYFIVAVILVVVLLAIIAILLLYYAHFFHRFKSSHIFLNYSRNFYVWAKKHKYKVTFALLVIFYIACALLIKYYEHRWAIENTTYNIFDSFSFFKTLSWLFVFGSSGFNDNIFPLSPQAKIIASLIPFVGLSGIIAILGFYIFDKIKHYFLEVSGMGTKNTKNHIILCGWNNSAKYIIDSFVHKNLTKKEQIVIMAQDDKTMNEIIACNFNPLYVSFIKGNPSNRADLDRANFKDAKAAIILSLNEENNSDATSILSVLTIEKYSTEQLKKGLRKEDIYTVVEIKNTENEQLAYDADADQVISIGGIESKIFTQAIMNPGIGNFLREVMTYNDQNDVYSFQAKENCPLIGKNFDTILKVLREYKVLLLSINIGYKKTREEAEEIVKKYDLDDPVITNPFKESECNYLVQKGDLIIVLAQYQSTVDEALKKIN